jgi:streptogramin lyase
VDPTRINRVAQDSTGQVWGTSTFTGGGLYRWEGDKWNFVSTANLPANPASAVLTTGPDGAVYCLWSERGARGESTPQTVTWHKGNRSKTLAQFAADVGMMPNLFVDPHKNIWVTGRSTHIYRVTPDGKAECVYTVEYDHRYESNLPSGALLNFDPLFATADGQGRVWFWTGGPMGGGVPTLDGILTFDGTDFKLQTSLPGPARKRYAVVKPDGPDHMWLAGRLDHLYWADTHTLLAEVAPEPASGVFRYVQKIFDMGGATYVLTAQGNLPVAERGGEGRIGTLWRLQDGQWTRVLNGIDMRPPNTSDPPRMFVETPQGLWLGAYGTGPWFIPSGHGEPIHIDWRYGFSLEESEGLLALPDGGLLVVAGNGGNMAAQTGTMAVKPADLLASLQQPDNVETLNPLRVFVPDRQNHLWGFLSAERKVISEWDGRTWTEHALPDSIDPLRFWNYGVDSQDRIWLHPSCAGQVYVFSPASGKTETYPDYSAALQAQLPAHETFRLHGDRFALPSFTPAGQIGFHDSCGQAHYFNGQNWQSWRPQDIDPSQPGAFDGPAFFDRAGNFALNMAGKTWEYAPGQGWHMTAYEKGLGTDQEQRLPRMPQPPPGCEVGNPESVAQDRLGTYWLTARGQLYRAIPGLCVRQFAPGQRQPFRDLRTIRTALIDPEGNAFLETYFHSHPNIGEYVIVKARAPLPQTRLRATVEETGNVKLQFESQAAGKVRYTWRVDGGAWTTPSESTETTAPWLANGKHTIETAALDDRLQIDPTPATAEVTIHVDPQKQLAALVEQLKDPDYSRRDAAVAGLVRQPALALPLLQSARENASADQLWWIDAAIEQIKDRLAKEKP